MESDDFLESCEGFEMAPRVAMVTLKANELSFFGWYGPGM